MGFETRFFMNIETDTVAEAVDHPFFSDIKSLSQNHIRRDIVNFFRAYSCSDFFYGRHLSLYDRVVHFLNFNTRLSLYISPGYVRKISGGAMPWKNVADNRTVRLYRTGSGMVGKSSLLAARNNHSQKIKHSFFNQSFFSFLLQKFAGEDFISVVNFIPPNFRFPQNIFDYPESHFCMSEAFFDIFNLLFGFHGSFGKKRKSGNEFCAFLSQKISHIEGKVDGNFNFLSH